jgi:hypothetical protein
LKNWTNKSKVKCFLQTEHKFEVLMKIYKQLSYFVLHLQNYCVFDILLLCECMKIRIRFLKIFDPIVTEISSAHIERGLAHGSALSLDLSHFRLRILGCNKNMKISKPLKSWLRSHKSQIGLDWLCWFAGKFSKTAPTILISGLRSPFKGL